MTTHAIFTAGFEVKGLTLGFDGTDAFTPSLACRSGEVEVSMVRPERRRRLELRSSSLETVEPFRFSAIDFGGQELDHFKFRARSVLDAVVTPRDLNYAVTTVTVTVFEILQIQTE